MLNYMQPYCIPSAMIKKNILYSHPGRVLKILFPVVVFWGKSAGPKKQIYWHRYKQKHKYIYFTETQIFNN